MTSIPLTIKSSTEFVLDFKIPDESRFSDVTLKITNGIMPLPALYDDNLIASSKKTNDILITIKVETEELVSFCSELMYSVYQYEDVLKYGITLRVLGGNITLKSYYGASFNINVKGKLTFFSNDEIETKVSLDPYSRNKDRSSRLNDLVVGFIYTNFNLDFRSCLEILKD